MKNPKEKARYKEELAVDNQEMHPAKPCVQTEKQSRRGRGGSFRCGGGSVGLVREKTKKGKRGRKT